MTEVFLHTTDLDENSRGAYLDGACGRDQDFRREVESLLSHHSAKTIIEPSRPRSRGGPQLGPAEREATRPRRRIRLLSGLLTQRRVIAYVLASLVAIGGVAVWIHAGIREALRHNLDGQLKTVLAVDVAAVEMWLQKQIESVKTWVVQPSVIKSVEEIVQLVKEHSYTTQDLQATHAHDKFLQTLRPVIWREEVHGVHFVARNGHMLGGTYSPQTENIYASPQGMEGFSKIFRGKSIIMKPFWEGTNLVGYKGDSIPLILVGAPVRNAEDNVIAGLIFWLRIDHKFTKLLSLARIGTTGETYAFDRDGVVLSNLRAEERLRKLGLIPAEISETGATLNLLVRDPGRDLTAGPDPNLDVATRPLTRLAALAIANQEAVDVDGYRNYLGVKVVGASKWLPRYGFGVITELEVVEAYAPIRFLNRVFAIIFSLLAISVLGALSAFIYGRSLKQHVRQGRRLGQYTLGVGLGSGGMGTVYEGNHATLKRLAAVKVLEADQLGAETIARFEREVQLATRLSHPNTITIYDYGRADDGSFYYAMEYLHGVTLAQLVSKEGALPAGRVIHILKQICGSLKEAHGIGLIHMDIKPQNIMLCRYGGEVEVVKVLDFGLVKDVGHQVEMELAVDNAVVGTPSFMAPERIRDPLRVDARADIYSLGALIFYLLAGRNAFRGLNALDICYQVLNETPPRPSQVVDCAIPPKLDQLSFECMTKDPNHRPQKIGDIIATLDSITDVDPWGQTDAEVWWGKNTSWINGGTKPSYQDSGSGRFNGAA